MTARPSLAPFADLPRLDAQGLAASLGPLEPQDFLQLLAMTVERLPGGLIQAEAVHVQAEAPPDRAPLSPGSDWYAVDRALLVVVDAGRPDAVERVLDDLATYARLSRLLFEAAATDPELAGGAGPDAALSVKLRLAAVLGTSVERWSRVDEDAPGLRSDIEAMLEAPFEAPIHLHPHVRPGWLAAAGATWARKLRALCPAERPWIVMSDGGEVVELLSPYVRDLSAALGQWAIENPGAIRTPGLREAWQAGRDEDLATMVVPDLLRAERTLNDERRANERTQGMFLEDRLGTQAGYVELGRLAAPDRRSVPAGVTGTALVAAGGPRPLSTAIIQKWLTEGGISGLAAVCSAPMVGSSPVVPEVLADEDDAYLLPGTHDLLADAQKMGLEVDQPEVLVLDGARRSSACKILGQLRRAQLCGRLDGDLPVFVVFVPIESPEAPRSIEGYRATLNAARLVLRQLSEPEPPTGSSAEKRMKNPSADGMPRRFRA